MSDVSDDGGENGDSNDDGMSPLRELHVIASQQVSVTDDLDHCELYTMKGLLTILWHGNPEADQVVLMGGGAMGGLLGPADGLAFDRKGNLCWYGRRKSNFSIMGR